MDARAILTICVAIILALAAWSLRPSQPKAESSRFFIGGANDGFFRLLFTAKGFPRRYAWLFPIAVALLFIVVVWLVLPLRGT